MEKPSSKPGCIWTREEAGWSPGQVPRQGEAHAPVCAHSASSIHPPIT